MIADQLEATARSKAPADDAECDAIIRSTVGRISDEGQLDESGLTRRILRSPNAGCRARCRQCTIVGCPTQRRAMERRAGHSFSRHVRGAALRPEGAGRDPGAAAGPWRGWRASQRPGARATDHALQFLAAFSPWRRRLRRLSGAGGDAHFQRSGWPRGGDPWRGPHRRTGNVLWRPRGRAALFFRSVPFRIQLAQTMLPDCPSGAVSWPLRPAIPDTTRRVSAHHCDHAPESGARETRRSSHSAPDWRQAASSQDRHHREVPASRAPFREPVRRVEVPPRDRDRDRRRDRGMTIGRSTRRRNDRSFGASPRPTVTKRRPRRPNRSRTVSSAQPFGRRTTEVEEPAPPRHR